MALIASHVIQYQAPFFRLLAAHPDIDLTVLFGSRDGSETYRDAEMQTSLRWDIDLLGGYRHVFLRNFGRGQGYARLINPGIIAKLIRGRYDAVILFLGWGTITSLLAIATCLATSTPFMLYGDSSHPPPAQSIGGRVRARFLRMLFKRAAAFLVSGSLNAEYYRHYGASGDRFFLTPWAIDNERFEHGSAMTPAERDAMRAGLGIARDRMAIVFSAKFLPRKDPMTLLRAVQAMRNRDRVAVVFLGHGELRGEMERFAAVNGIAAHFAGFVNQADLPRYYGAADVFVLPSIYEPRGSVVNEAMASGLPVVVTDRCGAIGDIVLDGDNALVYPAGDATALAAHLDMLVEQPELRAKMGQRSREIIATWSYERGIEGVMEALGSTC